MTSALSDSDGTHASYNAQHVKAHPSGISGSSFSLRLNLAMRDSS